VRDVTKKAAAALEARIPNIATLEAKIRDLINPAPERRADCLFQIQRALFHVKIPPLGPRPPSTAAERELLEQILKGLRTVKVALNALGADGATLGPDSVGTHVGYAEVQRYYEYVEKLLASRASRPRPRDWPKRDPAMLAAVAEAAGLLRVFHVDREDDPTAWPAGTKGGLWHELATELYRGCGGRSDVYQAIRDLIRSNKTRPA
jgi:hypothetical protein